METKLLQTQHLNANFFDEFVDLQKPIETLRESLSETIFDLDNKYPYSEEISDAVLSLIEEVYEEWNETSKDRHEFDYYNLEDVEQKGKTLSYLVLHAVDSEYSSSGSSIDSEETIHFL